MDKNNKLSDQMILESYWYSIMDIMEVLGKKVAEKFALEIIHYGATLERKRELPWQAECTFESLKPFMDNSRKNVKKATEKNQKVKKKENSNCLDDVNNCKKDSEK